MNTSRIRRVKYLPVLMIILIVLFFATILASSFSLLMGIMVFIPFIICIVYYGKLLMGLVK